MRTVRCFANSSNSRAVFLGFPLAMILEPDGTVVERIETKKLDGRSRRRPERISRRRADQEALCLFPRRATSSAPF